MLVGLVGVRLAVAELVPRVAQEAALAQLRLALAAARRALRHHAARGPVPH